MDTSLIDTKAMKDILEESNRIKDVERRALERLNAAQAKLNASKASLAAREAEVNQLQDKLSTSTQTLDKYNIRNKLSAKMISDLRKKAYDRNETLGEIYETLNECKVEKDRFYHVNSANKESINKLHVHRENQLSQQSKSLAQLGGQLQDLNFDAKCQEMREIRENCIGELIRLKSNLSGVQNRLLAARTRKVQLLPELDALKVKIVTLEEDYQLKRVEHEALQAEISNESVQLQELEEMDSSILNKLTDEIDALDMAEDEIDFESKELNEQNVAINEQLNSFETEIKEYKALLSDMLGNIEICKTAETTNLNELQGRMNNLGDQLEGKKTELDCKLLAVKALGCEIELVKENNQALSVEVTETEKLLERIKLENEGYVAEEVQVSKETKTANKEASKMCEEIALLRGKTELLAQQIQHEGEASRRKLQAVSEEQKQIEIETSAKRCEISGDLQKYREDFEKDSGKTIRNYQEITGNLEVQLQDLVAKKAALTAKTTEDTAELKGLTMQSHALAKQIKSAKVRRAAPVAVPVVHLPPPLPKVKAYNDLSDSSTEGTCYTPQQINANRLMAIRRKMMKSKRQKSQETKP